MTLRGFTAFLCACTLIASAALGATPSQDGHKGHDSHAAHHAAMKKASYQVSDVDYDIPDVELLDHSGAAIPLRELVDSEDPIALNFIFTTCTTICPVMTVTFAQMQNLLGTDAERLQLVSISIDPEYDRPDVLRTYANQFRAGDNWSFLTGDTSDIVAVLRSFDSYTGSKMSHRPVTLLKRPDEDSWTRIDGLANGESLAMEVSTRLLN